MTKPKLKQTLATFLKNRSVVEEFNPAQQNALAKLTTNLIRNLKANAVLISDSVLGLYADDRTYIEADVAKLIGDKVNLQFFTSPDIVVKLKQVTGAENTIFIEDKEESSYFVTNGSRSINLLKPEPEVDKITCPVAEDDYIGVEITDINLSEIKKYTKTSKQMNLLLYKDQLEQIAVFGQSPYTFNPLSYAGLIDKEPDKLFISTNFTKGMRKIDFSFRMAKNNYGHWLVSKSQFSHKVILKTYELLVEC